MRIREILVASLLTMTLGCPGDDSGDTDANTTPGTSTGTPEPTTTGTEPTTTGTEPTTTGTPEPTTTGTPETSSSSSDDGADSTTAGAETTTGGSASEECIQFCSDYLGVCGSGSFNDYGDEAGCLDACSGYDAAMLKCKLYHASVADGPESEHCGHANIDGGGVC